ncbi:MAG: hypothetical protein PHF35_03505 [Candidatus Moranbacteria bacterium]|nr:hypothetical protein [Candidatus Moranbacteria bacterium]
MPKKYLAAAVAGIAIAGALAVSQTASAYRGDPSEKGPNYDPQRHEEMQKAFDDNDYDKWKELMQNRGRVTEVVNEGNFSRFSEMHKLMLEGKTDEANAIRSELGLGQRNGNRNENGTHRGQNRGGNFVDENNDGICDRNQ